MVNQFLQQLILSQLVEAGREMAKEALGTGAGGSSDRAKEWIRLYWDLIYVYKHFPKIFPPPGPHETGPLATDRLELHQELLFYLVDAYAGDLSPQPSLQSLLHDKSIRLAAAREVAGQFEHGLQSMNEEITRLEQESKGK